MQPGQCPFEREPYKILRKTSASHQGASPSPPLGETGRGPPKYPPTKPPKILISISRRPQGDHENYSYFKIFPEGIRASERSYFKNITFPTEILYFFILFFFVPFLKLLGRCKRFLFGNPPLPGWAVIVLFWIARSVRISLL